MRLYEPFTEELISIASVSSQAHFNPVTLFTRGRDSSVSGKAFGHDQTVDVWHLEKLTQDLLEAKEMDWTYKAADLQYALAERNLLTDCRGSIASASVAVPIRKGGFLIGVIEFCSAEVSRLSYETKFFELVASFCADAIRRIELANDRGWLIRMSFIHAARHRIEAILRDIRTADREVAKELADLIQATATATKTGAAQTKLALAIESISIALKEHDAADAVPIIVSTLNTAEAVCGISERACELIADIFETLTANASHSALQPKSLSLQLVENAPSATYLRIDYAPKDVRVRMERMEQICIAPIPDAETETYHYGLFLLSTQVRMLGGAAYAKPIVDDGLSGTEFGVSFQVPIQ